MQKTITPIKVSVKTTKKDGTAFRNGSALIGVCIKDKEGKDLWLNSFGQISDAPQENVPITVDVYEEEYNGTMQWKFKFLSPTAVLLPRIETLEARVTALENNKLLSNPTVKNVTLDELAQAGL